MIVAIDVGGTHADGVILQRRPGKAIDLLTSKKIPLAGRGEEKAVFELIESLLSRPELKRDGEGNEGEGIEGKKQIEQIERIVVSSTVANNALAQDKVEPVGLLLIPGPGRSPEDFYAGDLNFSLQGYVDHRGRVVKKPRREEVKEAARQMNDKNIKNAAVVGKFSVRNPALEKQVCSWLEAEMDEINFISAGHRLSSRLNFPRRAVTACCDAAVASCLQEFSSSIVNVIKNSGANGSAISEDILYFLKSDGGTMTADQLKKTPIKAVNSGPAASIMGAMAMQDTISLPDDPGTYFLLDMGGTTTDIGIFHEGEPLFEPQGIQINHWPTRIRGLFSRSLAVGGDSQISHREGKIEVGPERLGPAAAAGGPAPTPTDALLILEPDLAEEFAAQKAGRLAEMDRDRALKKLSELVSASGLTAEELARKCIEKTTEKIAEGCRTVLRELKDRPVHTIKKLLEDRDIKPQMIVGMGGPARRLVPGVAEKLNLSWRILPEADTANAVGAGCARVTLSTTVRVDTERGKLAVPEEGLERSLDQHESFDRKTAGELARDITASRCPGKAEEIEITASESYPTVSGFRTSGEIIEVTAQIKPGPEGHFTGNNFSAPGADRDAEN